MAKKVKAGKVRENMTKVMTCFCTNEYQDTRYGRGRRVFNRTKQHQSVAARGWRCTGCGKEAA